jgi:SWI/SNF-related matrix-associated actin-dependent regulator of chromatin subfamily A member 5
MLRRVHELLKICMLRRLKSSVELTLKDKLETLLVCPMSELQVYWYRRVVMSDSQLLKHLNSATASSMKTSGRSWQRLQCMLAGLRKVCNHPYLLPGIDPNPEVTDDVFVTASGKVQLVDRLVQRLLGAGHRCTIFSQFTTTLDMLARLLQWRGVSFCRLDGSMPSDERKDNIRKFNVVEGAPSVFLLSTRAGGLGINLQTADTCILFDSDWNPQMDLQAMSRVHRIGQAKKVHVYRLVAGDSVEERILQRAQKRLYLDRVVNHDNAAKTMQEDNQNMKTSDWLELINLEAAATVSGDACRELTDVDLDAIIDRRRSRHAAIHGVLKQGAVYTAAEAKEALEAEHNAQEHRQMVEARAREELGLRHKRRRL